MDKGAAKAERGYPGPTRHSLLGQYSYNCHCTRKQTYCRMATSTHFGMLVEKIRISHLLTAQ